MGRKECRPWKACALHMHMHMYTCTWCTICAICAQKGCSDASDLENLARPGSGRRRDYHVTAITEAQPQLRAMLPIDGQPQTHLEHYFMWEARSPAQSRECITCTCKCHVRLLPTVLVAVSSTKDDELHAPA